MPTTTSVVFGFALLLQSAACFSMSSLVGSLAPLSASPFALAEVLPPKRTLRYPPSQQTQATMQLESEIEREWFECTLEAYQTEDNLGDEWLHCTLEAYRHGVLPVRCTTSQS